MSGIKPFGRFWDLDGDGFIVNDASGRKIPRDYLPAVSSSVSAYRDHLRGAGVYVRGIYLRGTVARGIPVRDVSDLDLFALVDDRANLDLPGMDGVERGLLEEYPMLGGAGLEVISGGDLGDGEYFSEADLLLSSQSVRLFGEDVITRLPRFKPGVLVANNDVFQISTDIREGIPGVESDPSPENTAYWGRRVCKNMIRAGFSLTLPGVRPKKALFTRDLYPCYVEFSKEYPHRQSSMRRAIEYAVSPPQHPEETLDFLRGFGGWLSAEAASWLEEHNPSGELELRLADHRDEVGFSRA